MPTNWLDELEKRQLFGLDEGPLVFFPLGALRGFLLPKRAYRGVIRSAQRRFFLYSVGIAAITTAIGVLFGIHFMAMARIDWFLTLLIYAAGMRRVTRRMHKLPFAIGFRYYARWADEVSLWQGVMLGMMFFTPLLLLGLRAPFGNRELPLIAAFFLCQSGSLLNSRYKQLRAEARAAE
jgi:hypothetical protein